MRILLVDDDQDIRAIMCCALAAAGHDVAQAANGQEALRKTAGMNFDLCIVDIFMPTMDGLETIRHFHGCSPLLPILAMSGLRVCEGFAAPNFLDAAVAFGAVSVLSKPFGTNELLCAVDRWAHRSIVRRRQAVQYWAHPADTDRSSATLLWVRPQPPRSSPPIGEMTETRQNVAGSRAWAQP